MLSVINDILDYSKIEAGKLDIESIDFDLVSIMENVSDVLAIGAYSKGLELNCLIDPEIPALLEGDPGRLNQILTNLTNNAVKFTGTGDVVLHAALEKEGDDSAVIGFSVTDTGIGIPENRLNDLFQSFHQVDSSHTRKYGGTGLGLAISKRLVEMMGGRMGVESEEGQGSTFWFTLELKKQTAEQRQQPQRNCLAGNKRILVVEANGNSRCAQKQTITSRGAVCEEALDGQEALLKLNAAATSDAPFHAALISQQLPDMDGEHLGRLIREEPALAELQLVMLTPVGTRIDHDQLKTIGFSAFLTKPVKQTQVLDWLAALMGKGYRPDAVASDPVTAANTIQATIKRPVSILLVEDNIVNQKLAVKLLDRCGYQVTVANNGKEAITALETADFQCVLMDVQMPEMDGFEATSIIRNGTPAIENTRIPIIAMTAHAMKGDKDRCFQAGMDDYIAKPIDPKVLMEKISRWAPSDAN